MENENEEIKWESLRTPERPVADNDLRVVKLPVKVIFEWSDEIVVDYDYENETVIEYTSGYVMKVLPNQSFVYTNHESIFIGSVFKDNKNDNAKN